MAAVDSLLRLMTVRSADTLVVASGQVPRLRRSGDVSQLSMPALQSGLVSAFTSEILAAADIAEDELGDSLETVYQSEDGDRFAVLIERRGDELRLTFRPQAAQPDGPGASPTSASAPAERAPPDTATVPQVAASVSAVVASDIATGVAADVAADVATDVALGPGHVPPANVPDTVPLDAELRAWQPAPGDAELRAELLAVFERAQYDNASDIVLSTGKLPRIRVLGQFVEIAEPLCIDRHIRAAFGPVLRRSHVRELMQRGSIDLSLEPRPGLRFRVNVFRQFDGLAAALRPIRSEIPRLKQLSLPEHLHELIDYPHGLVLVCGPTGSGKSTTLAALLEYVNRTRAKHVVTLEDPVEYRYQSRLSLIHQREVGVHVDSFDSGLRAALRESPDIIMVGEMRDQATIAAALTAAETGHLVLSTIHSSGAAMAIDRIIDVFPEHQQQQVRTQLSGALRATLTQLLLPSARGSGRVPVYEKMVVTSAVAHQIRDNKAHQIGSQILTGRAEGMVPLERTLADAVVAGRVSLESAHAAATEKQSLDQMIVALRTTW